MRLRTFIYFLVCVLSLNSYAQSGEMKFDFQKKFHQLTTKDGLSNNRILDVMQDRYGFIWVATEEGLNRFDANEFVVFKHDESDSTTISSNLITCIEEDIYGNLWIGTIYGLNKYDRKHHVFSHYFDGSHSNNSLRNNHIRALFADETKFLWIETVDGHLHQMDILSGEIKAFKRRGVSQPYYHYHSIYKQNDSSIWVGGRNQEVQRFNPKTTAFTYYRSTNSYKVGKRANDVSHYYEDSKGQMWVCGLDGAYKFDPITGDFQLFLSGSTFYIFEDQQSNLWFGTGNGIYIFNRKKEDWSHIISDVNNPYSLSNRNVNKIIQDMSGVIWVATNEGLNYYSPKLHQFSHYVHIAENEHSISGREVTSLVEDGKYLWVGTAEEGLNRLNLSNGEVDTYTSQSSPALVSNRISDLLLDKEKKLWIAQWAGKGMNYLSKDRTKTHVFQVDPTSSNYDWYHQIIDGKNNNLLIALWGGSGLYSIDKTNNKMAATGQELMVVPNEKAVDLINLDHDSIWWLGGENGRIRFFLPKTNQFYTVKNLFHDKKPTYKEMQRMKKYNYQNADIPYFGSIKKIVNQKKKCFFLTENSLLSYSYQHKKFAKEDLSNAESIGIIGNNALGKALIDPIKLLSIDSIVDFVYLEDLIFFITEKHLYKYSSITKKPERLNLNYYLALDTESLINKCLAMNDNNIFIGTNKGLIKIILESQKAVFLRSKYNEFLSYPVHLLRCISEGNQDDYWLGTTATGLARWFPKEQKLINYISDEFDTAAFWGWDVSFIYKDRKNRIWLGGEGLHLYDEKTGEFKHFTTQQGLPSNQILGMVEDQKGRMWMTTNKGISCFYEQEETFINYNEAVGLPDNEMTKSIIQLADHRLAAGLKNGFVIFHPDSLEANHYIPPVLLTNFQVINGRNYQDLTTIDSIILQPNENHIAFSIASLDYNSPNDNKYQYKLEGLDENWMVAEAGNRRVNYSNLKPGSYLLKLRGSNNNGIWNNNGKTLYIYIKPHYYEQWWFFVLIGLLVVFAMIMIVIYRIRELKLQNKAAQLEQRFFRSQMNPHFIFNSLGAIQNYIFKNEPLEAATYLSDFSNLVRMILNNSRKDLILVEEEIKTLKQYLELQKLRFHDKFDYKLLVDEQLQDMDYHIPPMLAQPFIENSIEHAFKGMKEKGLIKICFKLEEDCIRLICRDNGMGIQASMEKKIETDKKHQSLATKITHDRIKVLNKIYRSRIQLKIQDIGQIKPSEKGTQVEIEIPTQLKKI